MICTFYSYKGGVGRSMAMANVADSLSRRGSRVLMIDFDLEAPGLEQFFQINHDGIRRHDGLLDLLLSYKQCMSVARTEDAAFRRIESFICPVYERLPGGGRLDIMPAGQRQDPDQLARYALNLRTFDWQDFYFNWQGGLFFEWLRRALVPRPYDLVLVDSRTGVTEMGGICGYQLADAIVMLCAANRQNIQGTRNMLRDFRSTSVEALRSGRRLDIVIVPARIEQQDTVLMEDFFQRFEQEFGKLLPDALRRAGLSFRSLTIPYEPRFAFEERIVSDPAQAAQREQIGEAFAQLAQAVALLGHPADATGTAEAAARRPVPEPEREPAPRVAEASATARPGPRAPAPAPIQYDPAKRFASYDAFLDSSGSDREAVDFIARGLRASSLRVFLDREDVVPGANWRGVVEEALFHSRVLLFCVGPGGLSELRQRTLEIGVRARERGGSLTIVPVLLPGSGLEMLRGTPLIELVPLDLRDGLGEAALDRVQRAVEQTRSAAAPVEAEARSPFSGARAFLESDADLFFGREAEVERLRDFVLEKRVVTVVGPSGCGKSSLVHAGLVPLLRQAASGGPWTFINTRPGAEPLGGLLRALQGSGLDRSGDVQLFPDPDAGARLAEAFRVAAARASPGRLLVFLDPLEEIFILARREALAAFASALAQALSGLPGNAYVVLALRSSFLGAVRERADLWAQLEKGVFDVHVLSADELKRAIADPVERVGAAFEPGLVDRIVDDMRGEPGALSLLQVLLVRLWMERREGWLTNDAYARVGGLSGVLASQAEEIYSALDSDQQAALRRMMVRLVRIGRSKKEDACRRVDFDELLPVGLAAEDPAASPYVAVAKTLVDAGLLISSDENGRRVVEPAHESLLRAWRRLWDWLDDSRAFLRWRDRLAAQAAEWNSKGRPSDLLLRGASLAEAESWLNERRSELNADETTFIEASGVARRVEHAQRDRRRRITFALLGTAALVFLVLAVTAQRDRNRAEAAQRIAQAREREARELRSVAEARRSDAESQALVARAARDAAEKARGEADRQRQEAERQTVAARAAGEAAELARQQAERNAKVAQEQREEAQRARQEADTQRDEVGRQKAIVESEQQRADDERRKATQQETAATAARLQVQSQQKTLEGLLLPLRPSVLSIIDGGLVKGSGFFVSSKGLAVTAGQNVKASSGNRVKVGLSSGQRLIVREADVVRVDMRRDLALLRIRDVDPSVYAQLASGEAVLTLSDTRATADTSIVALGVMPYVSAAGAAEAWMPASGRVLGVGPPREAPLAWLKADDLITAEFLTLSGFLPGAPVLELTARGGLSRRVIGMVAYTDSKGNDLLIPAAQIREAFAKELAADR